MPALPLTGLERVEIRVGIERDESDTQIGDRLGACHELCGRFGLEGGVGSRAWDRGSATLTGFNASLCRGEPADSGRPYWNLLDTITQP